MYGKRASSIACILLLAGCARHKLVPVATPLAPKIGVPTAPQRTASENAASFADKKVVQAVNGSAEVNRLLSESPRMNLSAGPRPVKKDGQTIDKITVLVDSADGTLRPNSQGMIQKAFAPLADQFLLVCPDRMRVGTTGDCRFAARASLEDLFREQLVWQGVPASEAADTTLLVHADLTTPEKNAFDIRAVAANSTSNEQLWHIAPLNPGDHKLELRVTLGAKVGSAEEVPGAPVVLVREVSVIGENFFNQYWPEMLGCAAILALFGWIAMTFWRDARPSAFSSR